MMNKSNRNDYIIRFVFGGFAVVLTYWVSLIVPWDSFAGIFAAFPGVMAAAVIMAGIRYDSDMASLVAFGAVAGMGGCAFCVIGALIVIGITENWILGAILSVPIWFLSSWFSFAVIKKYFY